MGKVELEMILDKHMRATRYVTYIAPMPGHSVDLNASLHLFVDVMNVPGAHSSITGKGNRNLPHNIRATVEWEDVEVQEAKD